MTNKDFTGRVGCKETIHSGHFMVSDIDDDNPDDPDDVVVQDDKSSSNNRASSDVRHESFLSTISASNDADVESGFDFGNACKQTAKTYVFGTKSSHGISIDASLSKLFQCMTLAYSGKLTSPRWKTFKGLNLRSKEKIRLNNVIWRAWHMQFVVRKHAAICQFFTPVEHDSHSKPEAVVLEGTYWKRRMATVIAEYKNWRIYHKEKLDLNLRKWLPCYSKPCEIINSGGVVGDSNTTGKPPVTMGMVVDDDLLMDFSDTLFSSLTQPYSSQSRETATTSSLADFMQPGLIQLQPSLDELMDTFEPLQDIISLKSLSHDDVYSSIANDPCSFLSNVGQNQVGTFAEVFENKCSSTRSQDELYISQSLSPSLPTMSEYQMSTINVLSQESQNYCPTYDTPNFSQSYSSPRPPNFNLDSSVAPSGKVYSNFMSPSSCLQMLMSDKNLNDATTRSVTSPQYCSPVTKLATNLPPAFAPPQTSAPQAKPRRYSTPSSATKVQSATIRRCSNPNVASKRAVRPCVPIAPNPNTYSQIKQSKTSLFSPTSILQSLPSKFPNVDDLSDRSAVLAQVLTPGTYSSVISSNVLPIVTSSNVSNVPFTSVNQQTSFSPAVIISPVALAAVTGVSDFQSRLLVGAANKAFGSTNSYATPSTSPCQHKAYNIVSTSSSTILNKSSTSADGKFADLSLPSGRSNVKTVSTRMKSQEDKESYKQHRRVVHINAEQKRRFNIKYGFDVLQNLVPALKQNSGIKISKAQMLHKAAEYIRHMKAERSQITEEMERLKLKIKDLNENINACQTQLPITGAPIARHQTNVLPEMYEDYVRRNTLQNWKFWIFSLIIRSLMEKYDETVSGTSTVDEFCRGVLSWLDHYCSLVFLRPVVSNSLRQLSTTTDILSNPSSIQEEATKSVNATGTQANR